MEQLKWDTFRPFKKNDLCSVWATLRDEDRQELEAGGYSDPKVLETLLLSETSTVLTWETERGPIAVLGVTPTEDPTHGLVWAVASNKAHVRWRVAVRKTEELLQCLGRGYAVLGNYKDSRNIAHIEWLMRVGFVFINTYRAGELHYHEFVRIMK